MTDEDLDRLQALADAASLPPWLPLDCVHEAHAWMVGNKPPVNLPKRIVFAWQIIGGTGDDDGWAVLHGQCDAEQCVPERADLEFIAVARQAIPDLIAEVRRLRQQVVGHCERIAAQSEILSRMAEALPIHFSVVSFQAFCGADVPNQRTTQIREHVTCRECIGKLQVWEICRE